MPVSETFGLSQFPFNNFKEIIYKRCRLFYTVSLFINGITDGILFCHLYYRSKQRMAESLLHHQQAVYFNFKTDS